MRDNKLFDRDFWSDDFGDGIGAEGVKSALDSGADITATDNHGRTALHLAVERQDYSAAVLLLGHGANANAQSHWGDTPLHWAAARSNPAITSLLLANQANVNTRDHSGKTPLFHAVDDKGSNYSYWVPDWSREDIVTISILLRNGSDVNARDGAGATPLFYAVEGDRPDFCEVLLQHGADPHVRDANGRGLLHYATFAYFVIHKSLEEHCPLSKKALDAMADLCTEDNEGRTPLDYCAAVRNSHLLGWMLEHGVAALDYAFSNRWTPLHFLMFTDWYLGGSDVSVVEQLLNHGEDVNARDHSGRTPLHYAMAFGIPTVEGMQQLLNHGADINAIDKAGQSPLQYGAASGFLEEYYEECLERIKEDDIDIHVPDSVSQPLSHYRKLLLTTGAS